MQLAFSVAQIAARWGVSNRHVYDLCNRGELGHLRIGGLIRIRQEDQQAYEARQWVAPSSKPRTIDSCNAASVITFSGGKTVGRDPFRLGRRISAKRQSG